MTGSSGLVDPGEAFKYGVAALNNFSKEEKISIPADVIYTVASGGFGAGLNLRNDGLMAVNGLLTQISGTDVIDNLDDMFGGVIRDMNNPVVSGFAGLGVEAIGRVSDGDISQEDQMAIVQGASTMAIGSIGAAIGGVAGPIGAVIGTFVSAFIGAIFPPPPPPFVLSQRLIDIHTGDEQARDAYNVLLPERQKAHDVCETSEAQYWNAFEEFFEEFASTWQRNERRIGFKFDLRWFNDSYGPMFYAETERLRRIGGRWGYDYRYPSSASATALDANYQTFVLDSGEEATRCLLPFAGCPYPKVGHPSPIPGPQLPSRAGHLYSGGSRETRAFAARDLIWVPKDMRLDCDRYVPYPDSRITRGTSASKSYYLRVLQEKQRDLSVKKAHLDQASGILRADLARTIEVMDRYLYVMSNRSILQKSGVRVAELAESSERYIRKKNSLLNNTALAGGLGVLGFSLWKAFR